MARVYIKGKTKANIKRKPNSAIKAGKGMARNVGGFVNAKVIAIVKNKT